MRAIFAIVALGWPAIAIAQITTSFNSGCTIGPQGSMMCEGLSPGPRKPGAVGPFLSNLYIRLEPGASLKSTSFPGDCVLLGINGGGLSNEMAPFRGVDLEKNSVTLMPKEKPFRLRNQSSKL